MKLKRALEIAESCGLETVQEAFRNIRIHSPSLFVWWKEDAEMAELASEWHKVRTAGGFTRKSSVRDVMEWIQKDESEEIVK